MSVLWQRHIADSLQLIPSMHPLTDRAVDIGSGAGFPGLILALATGVPFDLIEADRRKAAFLREAARTTGAHPSASLLSASNPPASPLRRWSLRELWHRCRNSWNWLLPCWLRGANACS